MNMVDGYNYEEKYHCYYERCMTAPRTIMAILIHRRWLPLHFTSIGPLQQIFHLYAKMVLTLNCCWSLCSPSFLLFQIPVVDMVTSGVVIIENKVDESFCCSWWLNQGRLISGFIIIFCSIQDLMLKNHSRPPSYLSLWHLERSSEPWPNHYLVLGPVFYETYPSLNKDCWRIEYVSVGSKCTLTHLYNNTPF